MTFKVVYDAAKVVIDGSEVIPLECGVIAGYRSPFASATAKVNPSVSTFVGDEQIEIEMGYRARLRRRFFGLLDVDTYEWAPKGAGFSAVGNLAKTQEPTGIVDPTLVPHGIDDPPTNEQYTLAWINSSDGTIVTDILHLYGITNISIHDTGQLFATLAADVTSYYAVKLASNQAGWTLIQEIDKITGCVTFDAPDGTVTRIPVSGLPSDEAFKVFVEGADFSGEGANKQTTNQNIYNKVTVYGQTGILSDGTPYAITSSRTDTSPYIPTPPGTREFTFSSNLIETEDLAGTVAARLLGELNRRKEIVTLPLAIGDNTISVGMTIGITSSSLRINSSQKYRTIELQDNYGAQGYHTTLILEGAAALEGTDPNQPPVIELTYIIEIERLANGHVITVVYLDGSGSHGVDSDIGNYVWTGTPSDPTPIGDGKRAVIVYDPFPGTNPTVTLQVEDTRGKIRSRTVEIIKNRANSFVRDLWAAVSNKTYHSNDGQVSWTTVAVSSVILAVPAGDTYELAATSGGVLYRILADDSFTTPSGPTNVTALWISRDPVGTENSRAWAACSDGKVWQSLDGGITWTAKIALPNGRICNVIQESPFSPGELYAGGGNILYHTFSDAASWQSVYEHPHTELNLTAIASGIIANDAADPSAETSVIWIGYAGEIPADPLTEAPRVKEVISGNTKTVPIGESLVLDVTALTISLDAERIFVTDIRNFSAPGRAWTAPSNTTSDLTRKTYDDTGFGNPYHAIRDGKYPVIWGIGVNRIWKTIDGIFTFLNIKSLSAPEEGRMVSYGKLHTIAVKGHFAYLGTLTGSPGDTVKLIVLSDTGWEIRSTLPFVMGSGSTGGFYNELFVTENGTIFVYTSQTTGGRNVWRSTDNGVTWNTIADLTLTTGIVELQDGYLYAWGNFVAGTPPVVTGQIMRSNDEGTTWTSFLSDFRTDSGSKEKVQMAIDPTNNQNLGFISNGGGTDSESVSHNGGGSFTRTSAAVDGYYSIQGLDDHSFIFVQPQIPSIRKITFNPIVISDAVFGSAEINFRRFSDGRIFSFGREASIASKVSSDNAATFATFQDGDTFQDIVWDEKTGDVYGSKRSAAFGGGIHSNMIFRYVAGGATKIDLTQSQFDALGVLYLPARRSTAIVQAAT